MIATVRIAPVEHWCEHELEFQDLTRAAKVIGLPVQIDPSSMVPAILCDGKSWRMTEESRERLQRTAGANHKHPGLMICEHMLEMD